MSNDKEINFTNNFMFANLNKPISLKVLNAKEFLLRISDKDGVGALSIRRFVYCWKKLSDGWKSLGLFMVDDRGYLFDIQAFLADKENKIRVQILSNLFRSSDVSIQLNALCSEDTTQDYQAVFSPKNDYYFMFCPPDVISQLQPGTIQKKSDSEAEPAPNNPIWDSSTDDLQAVTSTTSVHDPKISELKNELANKKNELEDERLENILHFWDAPHEHWVDETDKNTEFGTLVPKNSSDSLYTFDVTTKKIFTQWLSEDYREYSQLTVTDLLIQMPVTMEEYLSRLQYFLHIVDLQYANFIKATEPFLKLNSQIHELEQIFNLMAEYPGFFVKGYKSQNNLDNDGSLTKRSFLSPSGSVSTIPSDQSDRTFFEFPLDKDIELYKTMTEKMKNYREQVVADSKSDSNSAYLIGKKHINDAVDELKKVINDKDFKKKISAWIDYLEEYENTSLYPFSIRDLQEFDENQSGLLIFELFQEVVSTLCSIDLGDENQESEYQTYAESIITDLGKKCDSDPSGSEMFNDFLNVLYEEKVGRSSIVSVKNHYKTYSYEESDANDSIINKVFNSSVVQKVIPGIWNSQMGMDSNITSIIKISSVIRSKMTLSIHQTRENIRYMFGGVKAAIGMNSMLTTGDLADTFTKSGFRTIVKSMMKDAPESAKVSARSILSSNTVGKASRITSTLTSSIGAAIGLLSIIDLINKGREEGYEYTADDILEFSLAFHGVGMAMTGVDFKIFSRIISDKSIAEKLNRIVKKAGNTLKVANFVISWHTAYQQSHAAQQAYYTGDDTKSRLLWVQSTCSLITGGLALAALLTSTGILAPIGGILGFISLSAALAVTVIEKTDTEKEKWLKASFDRISLSPVLLDGIKMTYYELLYRYKAPLSIGESQFRSDKDFYMSGIYGGYEYIGPDHQLSVNVSVNTRTTWDEIIRIDYPLYVICMKHGGAKLLKLGYDKEIICMLTGSTDYNEDDVHNYFKTHNSESNLSEECKTGIAGHHTDDQFYRHVYFQ